MRILLFFIFCLLLLASCKKYYNPKYPYDEQLCSFSVGKTNFNADSAVVLFDSILIDSVYAPLTRIYFMYQSKELLELSFRGRSIGSYNADTATYARFSLKSDSLGVFRVYKSTSLNLTVWEFDNKDSLISGDFTAEVMDSTGLKVDLQKGRFANVKY